MTLEDVPEGFWALPREDSISSEPLKLIYAEICARLKKELTQTGGSTVDLMVAERTAFLYTWIRDTETRLVETRTVQDGNVERAVTVRQQPFENQRNYKEVQQLWLAMASQLQKTLSGADVTSAYQAMSDMTLQVVAQVAVEVVGKSKAEELVNRLTLRLENAEA